MQTGDGLLARLMPIGTVPLAAFAELCAAARTHGNGVVEITARGSIQVRGLSAASATDFAASVAALGIAAQDGVPVVTNPLAGLDDDEILDAGALAADLRRALAAQSAAARLAPKISVAIDGGGALALDGLAADVRLSAEASDSGVALRLGVGGDGASAAQVGVVAPAQGVEAATRLLDVIARRGRDARARDLLATAGVAPFQAALAIAAGSCGLPLRNGERKTRDAIGLHRLRDGSLARGLGLAFGYAEASALELLAQAAGAAGASGMRAAPGRALMIIGIAHQRAPAFAAAAERLGFIVDAGDPRRQVVACAGAPICASAHVAARAIAPVIAASAAPFLGGAFTIHISGCAKACAHPGPAALTAFGTPEGCALVANGSTRDIPHSVVPGRELPEAIARYARERMKEAAHV